MNCLNRRLENIDQLFDAAALKTYIEGIYANDHWPSFKNFHKTAHFVADTLNSVSANGGAGITASGGAGITARVIEFPADGETLYGDWIMPLAWDAFSSHVVDVATGEVLADYASVPTSMVMGSGATPKGGVRASLVYVDKPADLDAADIDGKIVLTGFSASAHKRTIISKGGLAVLFANKIADDMNDAVRWVNSWSDDPGLWSLTKHDSDLPGVSLSVNQAARLRERLAAGEKIVLDLDIQTKTYDGTLPVVEAFIPGQCSEEVFITGHLCEQGANDNCSGGATMMEMARLLAGTKPKRGIRFLFTSEIYGTVPYCYENQDKLKNVIAGINIDSTAEVGTKSGKMDVIENPLTNPSFVNFLMAELIDAAGETDNFAFQNYLLDDNLVTDPAINIPCVLVGVCSKNWHTSFDTLEIVDWDLFNRTTKLCATWVDAVANGGEAEASLLKQATETYLSNWETKIAEQDAPEHAAAFRADYLAETKAAFRLAVNRIHPVYPDQGADRVSEAGPSRRYFGPPSFSQMSIEKRKQFGLNMWAGTSYFPCFYSNGERSKQRIAAYTRLSFGTPYQKTLDMLGGLEEAGYLI